jgi:hypothetical protein
MSRRTIVTVVCAAGLVVAGPVVAQENHLWPSLSLSAGAYEITTDDKISIGASTNLAGTEIDLDADLGLGDSDTLATFGLDWGFAAKHSLAFRYYSWDRGGAREIGRVLQIGDVEFPIGARLDANFDLTTIEAVYSYWFMRRDDLGVGASLGLVYLGLEASATGTARFGPGQTVETRSVSEETEVPVPMIGLSVKGSPTGRLVLYGEARYLPEFQIGDIQGEAAEYSIGAEYYLFGPVALGLNYGGTVYQVDLEGEDWRGSVDLTSDGLRAYLRASF